MIPPSTRLVCALLICLVAAAVQVDASGANCPSDPFADPKDDPCNPLRYIPSNVLTTIGLVPYVLVGIIHVVSTIKWGAAWMSALTIGCFTYATGLALRYLVHTNPDSLGIYIGMYSFVTLSPCAFIAAEYVLLGRLATHLNERDRLLVSPRRVTPFFVASDVTTFLIQGAGGGLSASSSSETTAQLGTHVFFAGLLLQLISFLLFFIMYLIFLYRVYTQAHNTTWLRDAHSILNSRPARSQSGSSNSLWTSTDWRILALALFISCIGIIIRSIFRVIELSQGFGGPISRNEGLFYAFDCLPLFIAIVIYVPFWPGRFIGRPKEPRYESVESVGLRTPGSVYNVASTQGGQPYHDARSSRK